jgi:hypothetical protein
MSEYRQTPRPGMPDRRSFPRPPLWLNLALLVLALATFAYARYHREQVRAKTTTLLKKTPNSPEEINKLRDELASMDLTREQLAKELDGRMDYLKALESEHFYISIDTQARKMEFRLGKDVVRIADVQVGAPATVEAGQTVWRFPALKGGFNVDDKAVGYDWRVPEWFYVMNKEPIPAERPLIDDGLGKYVIFLPNNYVIHSPPPDGSPLKGPKPGSFMVAEADLAAIWPRISKNTRVYVF